MADNVTANPGSGGATFKTDEDTGTSSHVPVVKLELGANNSFDGYVSSSNPLPVDLRTDNLAGNLDVNLAASAVELSVNLQDGAGTDLTSTLVGADQSLDVNVTQSALPSGASTAANQTTLLGHVDEIEGLLTTIDADTGSMATNIASIAGTVSGTELQVDIVNTPTVDTELTTADVDTGAGTDTRAVVGLVGTASGGGQLIPGSSTDGLLVNLGANNDVTVTGTVTSNAGTGPWPVTDNGGSLTVDGTVAATQSGTWTVDLGTTDNAVLDAIQTATELIDDAIYTDGVGTPSKGMMVMGSDGTNPQNLVCTPAGILYVSPLTEGTVAHDSADSGNPSKIGAKAESALSGITLVADGDRTDLHAGVDGVLITRPHCNLEDVVSGNASNTDGTSTSCIAAQGAGIKTYLTTITVTNTSSTDTYVEIKDGTTAKHTIPVPANGGATLNLPVPLGGTANTAWNFDPGAAVTTMYCSMIGFKSKV